MIYHSRFNYLSTLKKIMPIRIVVFIVVIILIVYNYFDSLFNPYLPGKIAINNLKTTDIVEVQENSNEIVFKPRLTPYDTGVILYADSSISPGAYSPIAMKLAEKGILVVLTIAANNKFFIFRIMNMIIQSCKISQFDRYNRFTNIKNWFIGGHGMAGPQVLYQVEQMISTKELEERLAGIILMAGQPMTYMIKFGQKKLQTVITQTTLKKNDLCSLYFSHNRAQEFLFFNAAPVSKEYEKGAISQLPLKYRRIVQTQVNYYQFADYELNKKSINFTKITQHTIKFIRQCLDKGTWDKSYYNDNQDTEKSKTKDYKQDSENKQQELDQL